MRLSQIISKAKVQLNWDTWNRRPWEKGYIGAPLPKQPRTGRPPQIVTQGAVSGLQRALMREWNVMQWLANPYLNEEKEKPYLERHGDIVDQWKESEIEAKQRKMPNKSKLRNKLTGEVERRRSNTGNLLHAHLTVEDQMRRLIRGQKWD